TGGTADRNRSHWSTSKTPSYTKSVSWQHHQAAFEWFTKAAECNDATAWYNLAIMYHYGEGRPVDLRQALDLYRKVQSSGTRDVSQEIRETEDLL
ncbi:tetratricopeptide repeat protein, partial [Shigella sonnei]|uniref:tetratricopeptide repeat protein n=1 Tax=Shigella sonnei TaxID=624 RepID=UPI00209530D9